MNSSAAKARHAGSRATMRAAVIQGPRQLRVVSAPLPQPGPTQVRVAVEGCGVCASNLPPWEGRPWFEYPMEPGALGHEAWGRIDALGQAVTDLPVGQRVALLGYHGYAQYDLAERDTVVALPPQLDDVPFPGEPLACAVNVFKRTAPPSGAAVAVVGVGFLGALLVQLLERQGYSVIALSRRPMALELARRCGAAHTFSFNDAHQARELAGDGGFPCVIECTGAQEALDLAGDLTATRGRLVIAGYHQDGLRRVNMQQWNWRGIDVINAHERDPAVYVQGLRDAVQLTLNGTLRPTPLYTHRFTLDSLDQALETARQRPNGFLKALVFIDSTHPAGSSS